MSNKDWWYKKSIAKKWNNPEVKALILTLLDNISEEGSSEDLDEVEQVVFGKRVEHKKCGSMILPGAPECWGCGEPL